MRIEFQEDVLRFLVQEKEGKQFIPIIDSAVFDFTEYKFTFELIVAYVNKYKSVPKKGGLLEFFDSQSKKTKLSKEVYTSVDKAIRICYQPFEGDSSHIKDNLIEHAQYKSTKEMMTKYSPILKDGMEVFKKMEREMTKITRMREDFEAKSTLQKGGFVLRDHEKDKYSLVDAHPTYLKSLNSMTGAKGFYSPQLIILMGGPKSFKTGALINIATEYMRDGLKVYYVDMENGKKAIRGRVKQQMGNLTLEELLSKEHDEMLNELAKRYMAMGGDMVVEYYPANISSTDDVDEDLTRLDEEEGWRPDMIIWDWPDKMTCVDKSIKDPRIKISHVYHDIIRLHNKWEVFGIGVSSVNKAALDKTVIDMRDFGEDFQKAYNAHAAFALCATPGEAKLGIRRIVPVLQREGVPLHSGKACVVRVNEARMAMVELDWKEAEQVLSEAESGVEAATENKRKYIKSKPAPPETPSIKKDLIDE